MERARLKQSVEEEVLAQAKQFSEWKEQDGGHNFEEMEAKALEIGQAVAQLLLNDGVADEQQLERQRRTEAEPKCPKCGRVMRYGGQPGKKINSKVGQISLKRDYYHCQACKAGVFPPGPAVGSGGGEVE